MRVELLTIDEFRKRLEAFKREEEANMNKIQPMELELDKIISPITKQSKKNLETIIRKLPGYNDEEKEMIVEAFEDGFKLLAEDCIQYGIRIGSGKAIEG
jgi:hypothetical protein